MPLRLNVGRVVVQDVEDKMRLVLMRTDDARIAGYMVGDQRVSAHTFHQSKVFAAISGIDGVDLGFDALTVAEPLTGLSVQLFQRPHIPNSHKFALAPTMGARYYKKVRVIARGTLNGFVRNRVDRKLQKTVKAHLDAWYAEATKAEWKTSAELKSQYSSASIVSAERVVFNIKGNDYSLVVAINYHCQVLLIKWLGTHKEYDNISVEEVTYEEDRYADPSH
jgi:mRNA interferase HigB